MKLLAISSVLVTVSVSVSSSVNYTLKVDDMKSNTNIQKVNPNSQGFSFSYMNWIIYTGQVCSYLWDDVDASVFCRQMGWLGGIAYQVRKIHHVLPAEFKLQCASFLW